MENIQKYIDHTVLKPDINKAQIQNLCYEAKEYGFYSVCVNGYYVDLCRKLLTGSDVKICCVVGFPLGSSLGEVKAFEAKQAIRDGADEIDMVMNIAALKNEEYETVLEDIKAVAFETKGKAILKVIIETCLLTDDEKVKACQLSMKSGADFVKTSTGFSKNGATALDVRLMKRTVGEQCRVKASGGIRTLSDVLVMIDAGADRIGVSSSVDIMCEINKRGVL